LAQKPACKPHIGAAEPGIFEWGARSVKWSATLSYLRRANMTDLYFVHKRVEGDFSGLWQAYFALVDSA
jgi:hypothetical protein